MREDFALDPQPGAYPFRLTHEDRFQYRVKVQPVAGHLEFSIRPVDTRLAAMAARRAWEGHPLNRKAPAPDTDRADNERRAKLRAKGVVRLMCMELRVDRMLTFTIRKVDDCLAYDDVLRAWDIFRRMAVEWDKGFAYIATPERQKNGQYHIHAGIHGFININIIRRMWQSALNRVMGRSQLLVNGKDSPGAVNITHKPLRGESVRKSCKVAAYISKYIGKSLDVEFNRKKYFATKGVQLTPAQRQWLESEDRESALVEVLERYGVTEFHEVNFWNRDACSVWFRIPATSIPPPF